MTIAYLNGEFVPLEKATISPMDRGFLFADGVYEVIPIYAGRPFRLSQHLDRLQQSLAAIQLQIPLSIKDIENILLELLKRNAFADYHQSLYLQCTRGPALDRDHAFPKNCQPTIFAYCTKLPGKSVAELSHGTKAITLADTRWQNCHIKSIALLPNVLARQQAIEAGAQEAIFLHDSYVLEGSSTNLFMVKDGHIKTPPLDKNILGGITRELVIELCEQQGYRCQECPVTERDLRHADEIWLTSSNREILPVIELDQQPVGSGKAGPVWYRVIEAYQQFKKHPQ